MHTLTVAGSQRRYLVQTPRGYRKGKKYPLMVLYPHSRRGPRNFSDRVHVMQGAAKLGYLLAVPQATGAWQHGMCASAAALADGGVPAATTRTSAAKTGGGGRADARAASTSPAPKSTQPSPQDAAPTHVDIDFAHKMLASVKKEYDADPRRIYLMGVGTGAAFAERMASEMPDKIAALVSVAGPTGCSRQAVPMPARPVTALIIDAQTSPAQPSAGSEPITSALGYWMRANRCTAKAGAPSHDIAMDCPASVRMKHVGVPGLRNEWPVRIGRKYTLRHVHEFFRESRR